MQYAILTLIAIIFIAREITTYKQAKQMQSTIDKLTDKLMAKDFKEYHETITPLPVYAPVSVDDKELYNREIESMKV
jgi:hypothetical protein